MEESTEVVVRRFTQVIDVSLQIQGLVKVDTQCSVVTVSERCTTEPAILVDIMLSKLLQVITVP